MKKTIQEREKLLEKRIKFDQSDRRTSEGISISTKGDRSVQICFKGSLSPLEAIQRKRLKERRRERSNMKRNKVEPSG